MQKINIRLVIDFCDSDSKCVIITAGKESFVSIFNKLHAFKSYNTCMGIKINAKPPNFLKTIVE